MSKVNQDELFRVVEYSADAAERIGALCGTTS